jgi:hypothetical protein
MIFMDSNPTYELSMTDAYEKTVLHKAAEKGNYIVLNYLLSLEKSRAMLEAQDADGCTPLLAAINRASFTTLSLADYVSWSTDQKQTILRDVRPYYEIAKSLLAKGASAEVQLKASSPILSILQGKIANGISALDLTICLKVFPVARLLIQYGARTKAYSWSTPARVAYTALLLDVESRTKAVAEVINQKTVFGSDLSKLIASFPPIAIDPRDFERDCAFIEVIRAD